MSEREQYTDPQRPHHRERHVRTPTGELSRDLMLRRERGHVRILTLALLAVLAMLAYAAAFDLNHWAEWIVFGGICAVAVGFMIAVHAR
jgi:fatty acid desaturase